MRVTISHNRTKQDVIKIVDKSLDDVFTGAAAGMIQVTDTHKSWNGDTLNFSLNVRAGFLAAPIKGYVLVSDKDVTIDCDLGIFEKFIPQAQAQAAIESRVKGLLT